MLAFDSLYPTFWLSVRKRSLARLFFFFVNRRSTSILNSVEKKRLGKAAIFISQGASFTQSRTRLRLSFATITLFIITSFIVVTAGAGGYVRRRVRVFAIPYNLLPITAYTQHTEVCAVGSASGFSCSCRCSCVGVGVGVALEARRSYILL